MNESAIATPGVAEFAAAVREALSDLPADDVDELTEGLDADLAEEAEESGADHAGFGDPVAYAEELRAAAGLPPRATTDVPRVTRRGFREWAEEVAENARRNVDASPWLQRSVVFLISLRPVWWVLRGWAVYQLISETFGFLGFFALPTSGPRWLALAASIVVSVQWGRGRWLPLAWMRWVKVAVSVVAAIALVVLVPLVGSGAANAATGPVYVVDPGPEPYYPTGLSRDNEPISNIFAYDANGEPLTGVQLFDQDGEPLNLIGDEGLGDNRFTVYDAQGVERIVVPSSEVPGRAGWNVYPLDTAASEDIDWEAAPEGIIDPADVRTATPPFLRVQPLAIRDLPGASDPSPSPTAPESASPTPEPSPAG